jgi:gas vesicle protein
MDKDHLSSSLFALMAGATVGAGVGLLLTPQSGSQFRSSLREWTRKAKGQVDRASEQSTGPDAMQSSSASEGIRMPGAECSTRSKDHTIGDTGQDN